MVKFSFVQLKLLVGRAKVELRKRTDYRNDGGGGGGGGEQHLSA